MGRPSLAWCHDCNLAILDSDECPVCGSKVCRIQYTRDVRPAFPYDLDRLRRTVDGQFGDGCYDLLVPDDRVVLFGIDFKVDVGYTVFCDGQVLGEFDADAGRWTFTPNERAAGLMSGKVTKHTLMVTSKGISMAQRKRGIYGSDILDADPDIRKGDAVFIKDSKGVLRCVGISSFSGEELSNISEKTVVRNTFAFKANTHLPSSGYTWKQTVQLNEKLLNKTVKRSVDFIRRITKKYKELECVVSLSGGKDSLAVLLLTLKAGIKPTVMYADTHMDCDSSELVKDIVEKYGLKMISYGLPEEVFYRNLERLGPPSVDFRWCCKVHQISVFYILANMIGGNILSLVGLRRYESTKRMKMSSVWQSDVTPNQLCASPIFDWNALHIWMFLTMENAPYNKLYEQGFDRIGCYVCPVSNMSIMMEHKWDNPVALHWEDSIKEFGQKNDMPQVWYDRNLWANRSYTYEIPGVPPDIQKDIEDKQRVPNYSIRIEGNCSHSGREFDPAEVLPFLPIVGMKGRMENGWLFTKDLKISPDGKAYPKDGDVLGIRKKANDFFDVSMMATMCLECNACTFACKKHALTLEGQKIHLDASKCNGCRKCISVCPAVYVLRPRRKA